MGCLVLDGEVEDFLVCKAVFEVRINLVQINLFLNLQLVIIREVERHRHVGLPHTAFHVVHGKGVLAGRKTRDGDTCVFIIRFGCS